MRITVTISVATTMRTATDTPVAITTSMFGVLCVEVGVTTLVEEGMVAQIVSLISLILTGQSGSNLTSKNPIVIVAPRLTQSSTYPSS